MSRFLSVLTSLALAALLTGCSGWFSDRRNKMIVSVADQKMLLLHDGNPVRTYPVSTSRFGLGDGPRTNHTPLGRLAVAEKIGSGAPSGAVFKSRRPTGEVLRPNAPGRDPIVTRILWLRGLEPGNRNAHGRYIYIHGTPREDDLGKPASYGCIRMASRDIIDLYNRVGKGAEVFITREPLGSRDMPPQIMAWFSR